MTDPTADLTADRGGQVSGSISLDPPASGRGRATARPPDVASLGDEDLRLLVHAVLLEWTLDVEVERGRDFVDFLATSIAPLGMRVRHRLRLFFRPADSGDVTALLLAARRAGDQPVAITVRGGQGPVGVLPSVTADGLIRLVDESGHVSFGGDGRPIVDREATGDLTDQTDTRLALVNGLLWLRPLSRDRVPPMLRYASRPAHELFERCFFLVMTSTFSIRGTSWGTERRGEVRPDGILDFPSEPKPVVYDCKASWAGFKPAYRDILGFADYLAHPVGWSPPVGGPPRFLVISSDFRMSGSGSFAHRARQLREKVPGATLTTIRARDLVRFGVAMERARVTLADRLTIDWTALLDAGQVRWSVFENELARLRRGGYEIEV